MILYTLFSYCCGHVTQNMSGIYIYKFNLWFISDQFIIIIV